MFLGIQNKTHLIFSVVILSHTTSQCSLFNQQSPQAKVFSFTHSLHKIAKKNLINKSPMQTRT